DRSPDREPRLQCRGSHCVQLRPVEIIDESPHLGFPLLQHRGERFSVEKRHPAGHRGPTSFRNRASYTRSTRFPHGSPDFCLAAVLSVASISLAGDLVTAPGVRRERQRGSYILVNITSAPITTQLQ